MKYIRLTLKSLISSCCFNFSKNDWKKSLRSTWRGATHKASISAPVMNSYFDQCNLTGSIADDFSNLISTLDKVAALKVTERVT